MASYETTRRAGEILPGRMATGILPLFLLSLFLSAVLLFSVQPMFTKMVLPLLGGAPGVWNTSMVFFQAVLLAGYAYAHFSTKLLGARRQAVLHIAVLGAAFLVLPVALPSNAEPWTTQPELWLLWTLTQALGLPFLAVAATAPLLQKWFSFTGHPHANDPYFLYGASNIGSLIALLGYPFLIEPELGLRGQSSGWMFGYGLLAVLILACALCSRRGHNDPERARRLEAAASDAKGRPGWKLRAYWVVLALVPSSLLLGVTNHISTDVAAVPLLWVVPLAMYLLTFVIVFSRRPLLKHHWMLKLQPIVLIPLMASFIWTFSVWIAAPVHLIAFFVTAMVCHGELARRRPVVAHLTEFYLWMSFGGMIGGFFAALLAPAVFDAVIEYPMMIALACLLRPRPSKAGTLTDSDLPNTVRDVALPLLLCAALVLPPSLLGFGISDLGLVGVFIVIQITALSIYGFSARPLRLALGLAALFFASSVVTESRQIVAQDRSFFGVSRLMKTADGRFNLLVHGTTLHGAQYNDQAKWREPLTYYHRASPIGQLFGAYAKADNHPSRVGTIGLGIGTLACYRQPGQSWTFFEIDPIVEQIARNRDHFRYLSSCGESSTVVIGDARLSLKKEQDGKFDLLMFDAFSSDAIPMHLLTREALALYEAKLAPNGIMAFHISNRTLDLLPIVTRLAENAGLEGRVQTYLVSRDDRQEDYKVSSKWVVLARDDADLAFLDAYTAETHVDGESEGRWSSLADRPMGRLWSDDFSDILEALRW